MSIPFPVPPNPAATEHRRGAVPESHPAQPSRLFHNAVRHDADETALQKWWEVLGDEVLDGLVEACLKQNAELSLASLRVAEACAGLTGTLEEIALHPASLEAWTAFHSLRVRLVAATVRIYVDVAALQERLLCADIAIRQHGALLQRGRAASNDGAGDALHLEQQACMPELHLHRVRLQGERDATAVGLAWLVGEPVERVLARIEGRLLPPTVPVTPAPGTPDALQLRRPELLAYLLHASLSTDAAGNTARVDMIRREQACDRAVCEVERSLAVLASAIGEAAPARAAALSAGNRAGALVQKLRSGQPDHEAMLEANRVYHGQCDREIEVRARGYRALAALYEALGAGWPAPIETGGAR